VIATVRNIVIRFTAIFILAGCAEKDIVSSRMEFIQFYDNKLDSKSLGFEQLPDGGFLILTKRFPTSADDTVDYVWIKTDEYGKIDDKREIDEDPAITKLELNGDNEAIICGLSYDGYIFLYDWRTYDTFRKIYLSGLMIEPENIEDLKYYPDLNKIVLEQSFTNQVPHTEKQYRLYNFDNYTFSQTDTLKEKHEDEYNKSLIDYEYAGTDRVIALYDSVRNNGDMDHTLEIIQFPENNIVRTRHINTWYIYSYGLIPHGNNFLICYSDVGDGNYHRNAKIEEVNNNLNSVDYSPEFAFRKIFDTEHYDRMHLSKSYDGEFMVLFAPVYNSQKIFRNLRFQMYNETGRKEDLEFGTEADQQLGKFAIKTSDGGYAILADIELSGERRVALFKLAAE
jgi:WD40 repeat protein